MYRVRRGLLPAAGTAALLAACSDSPAGPTPELTSLDMPSSVVAAACETITFDQFAHGAAVTSVSVLGINLTVSASPYVQPNGAANLNSTPRAFDTDVDGNTVEDDDMTWTNGDCPDCEGLNSILVIDDERNTAGSFFWGDYRWGGVLRLSGFTGGTYYVESFTYVDNNIQGTTDVGDEPPAVMRVDGTTDIGSTVPGADGNVQVITTTQTPFSSMIELRSGTSLTDAINGSGGLDNVRVCRIATGFGVRTPGYWKNDKKPWPVTSITIGGITYTRAQADALMEAPTAGDKTYNMFEQLVAAKLNVLSGAVATCIQDTIEDADTWMSNHPVGSGVTASSSAWQTAEAGLSASASVMHGQLDQYNNGNLCAPAGN